MPKKPTPQKKPKLPRYRFHKGSGQAFVEVKGRRIYLGLHGSEKSLKEYADFLAGQTAKRGAAPDARVPKVKAPRDLTIAELVLRYLNEHVATYYLKNDRPTHEQENIRQAMRPLIRQFSDTVATVFGPLALAMVRDGMVADDLVRSSVNKRINRIQRMFRWAVAKQIIAPEILVALTAVEPLKRGRTAAKDRPPVGPVPIEHVEVVLPRLPRQVATMVRIQLLTGCRPGEVILMRPCDVDRTVDPWTFTPSAHKSQHHNKSRMIFLGPAAQEILAPWLLRDAASFCFSPAESRLEFDARRRAARKTKVTPSQAARTPKAVPKKAPGLRYTPASFGYAIRKACKAAGIPTWAPNQLRHARLTEVRRQFGLEAAQIIGGHANASTTEIYAERNRALAERVMKEIG